MIKRAILFLILIGLSACGGGDGGGSAIVRETCTKGITSDWETQGGQSVDASLDLSSFTIGSIRSVELVFSGGEVCDLDIRILGGECSGELEVSGSTYTGGGGGDPGCSDFNGTQEYNIPVFLLEICPETGGDAACLTYR